MKTDKSNKQEWLLFFYSVPSKPVSNRMKIWRMLLKAGAVQFKGAVYILPDSDDHYELFQWLVSSVTAMKGEAAFVRVPGVETMKHDEIVRVFDLQREKDYQEVGKRLDELERKVGKGIGTAAPERQTREELQKIIKVFDEIRKTDFFTSRGQKELGERLSILTAEIDRRANADSAIPPTMEVRKRRIADYQGRTWATRKRPFVDRIASAWLIRNFIDKKATFQFIDEIEELTEDASAFDMVGGEFTHVGDLCTFEVLVKAFSLKDKGLGVVAEIVHQLDLQDGRYENAAAEGLREILDGIRKTVNDDHSALEKGMGIFAMLHAANS